MENKVQRKEGRGKDRKKESKIRLGNWEKERMKKEKRNKEK